ncbi:MAG TPA: protein phosphatase 2C domain-containing protein [Vicinamibacterales bacterium]|nr:protein phosphatase 2C domain-containing protein [Vicinamibacterales bacterium]
MTEAVRTPSALRAAGDTNPGLHREVNEDRVHVDVPRGLFMVIDGVGGQAAGGKAADIALTMLRTRLERETGAVVDRVREAIAIANNEIHRAARSRPEWNGMACVLTIVVVNDGRAIAGHVGDTRLYKLRDGRIDKVTRDHSPVGEREDSHEISELEAMHHPRRNEVYRDVGSDAHEPGDRGFVDLHEIPFEPDAALLLCSDGLTDLIDSSAIQQIVERSAGRPQQVVKGLIDAANAAGGKDNVSAVYVEGERFAANAGPREQAAPRRRTTARQVVRLALIALLAAVIAAAMYRLRPYWPLVRGPEIGLPLTSAGAITVGEGESIGAALQRAGAGSTVVVEPGEYRETLALKDHVRLVSRVPRGATIRLPGTGSEADPAVIADSVTGAELRGFRIVGDAATPLGTGVLVRNADLAIFDVEVTGAVSVAIAINDTAGASLLASDIHDNPGAALAIRGASPRIAHNVFTRNGLSERVQGSVIVDEQASPQFSGNVFHGIGHDTFGRLADGVRSALARDNWFPEAAPDRSAPPAGARGRRGR